MGVTLTSLTLSLFPPLFIVGTSRAGEIIWRQIGERACTFNCFRCNLYRYIGVDTDIQYGQSAGSVSLKSFFDTSSCSFIEKPFKNYAMRRWPTGWCHELRAVA
jgi:hypothetical protein